MAFFNQPNPYDGLCCEYPCARSSPCDPCGTTTTTTTTTTTHPPCIDFAIVGASSYPNANQSYYNAGGNQFQGYDDIYYTVELAGDQIWKVYESSSVIYQADGGGANCPTDASWTSAGITLV